MGQASKGPSVWSGNVGNDAPGPDIKGNQDMTQAQWNATHHSAQSAPPPMSAPASSTATPQAPTPPSAHGTSGTMPGSDAKNSSGPGQYDPVAAANATAAASKNITDYTTKANRPNISTPFGSQQWHQNPDGSWSMGVGFSGQMAGGMDQLMGQAAHSMATAPMSGDAARNQAIGAAYGQATSRLNPQWQQSDEQLRAQLANQGLDPNSQAYQTAMQRQAFAKNDAYSSAMNNAIGQGTAAGQATFNENMAAREAPLNDLRNMYGLLPGTGFNSAASSQTPDYLAAQNNAMQQQLMQQQIQAQYVQAGAQLGSSIANGASDERVKQNIERHPVEAAPGVPLATFEYKAQPGQRYMGVIAQDLEKVAPQHVATGPDGIKRVSGPFRPFALPVNLDRPFGFRR